MARHLTANQAAESGADEPFGSPRWLFEACGILAATAVLVVIWLPQYPPGIDLPGHATQIHIWMNLDQGFGDTYRVNWFTPYLLGYAVARGFAELVGVVAALKLVLSLSVVAQYAAVRLLLRVVGAERWLALLTFPFFFGVTFYWGFLNFVFAVPLGLLYVALCLQFAEEPSARRGLVIVLCGPLLFFAHGAAYAVCATVGGVVLLPSRLDWRRLVVRTSPVVLGASLPIAWILSTLGTQPQSSRLAWRLGWERALEVPSQWVSFRSDLDTAGLGVALLLLVILGSGLRRNRRPGAVRPFLTAVAFYMLTPAYLLGTAVMHTRVGVFASCFALLLGVAPAAPAKRRWLRLRIVLAVTVLLGIQLWRSHGFAGELQGFDQVVEEIPADSRVCMSRWHQGSRFYPGLTYGHFDSWVPLQKPVTTDFSWASFYTTLIRFQPGRAVRFRFHDCEYVLARSEAESFEKLESLAKLEERAKGSLGFVTRSDSWYLLRRRSPPP